MINKLQVGGWAGRWEIGERQVSMADMFNTSGALTVVPAVGLY